MNEKSEALKLLEETLRNVANGGSGKATQTERMRAALSLVIIEEAKDRDLSTTERNIIERIINRQ